MRGLVIVGVAIIGLVIAPVAGSAQSPKPSESMSVHGTVAPHAASGMVPGVPTSASPHSDVSTPSGIQNTAGLTTQSGAAGAKANGSGDTHQPSNAPKEIREASLGVSADSAAAIKPVLKGLGPGGIKAAAKKLNPAMAHALKEFEIAKDAFAGFCERWHQKLVDRQVNNASHVDWKMQNGVETGTYVGYGPIKTCVCKQADNGIPIGELTYDELDYTISGKTKGEAKQAKPSVSVVPTREIFSWNKGKWFY